MKPTRILIVEDEPGVAFFLKEGLEVMGNAYQVTAVYSGEVALALVHREKPDLVVVDLRLPGINGLDFVQNLRSQGCEMPILLMTAYGNEKVELRSQGLGIGVVLQKPFGLPLFMEWVARLLPSGGPAESISG